MLESAMSQLGDELVLARLRDWAQTNRRVQCGSFRLSGLLTPVKVRVTRGDVPCGRARQVMKSLFNCKRSRVFGWSCVGPQTGYGACRKRGNRIVASF